METPHPPSAPQTVCVVGCGGWGTALSLVLHGNGHRVTLWGVEPAYMEQVAATRRNPRYLDGIDLPADMAFSSDLAVCLPPADAVLLATPTIYLRAVCERVSPHLRADHLVINVAKGIEEGSLLLGSGVVRDVCGDRPVAGLYGPSHAEEVARGLPTTVVATCPRAEAAEQVQAMFMAPAFRVYTNTDAIGVELGAALKNVIAIAAGICDGLGFGDNAKSALLTRGLAEIARLGTAMGARPETFAGLTGLGDLITTCISPYGRNRSVGMRIAQGETLDEIVGSMEQVAEGVRTTRSVCALADRHDVPMPIARAVHSVLFEGLDPMEAGRGLMERAPRPEQDRERDDI